MFPETAPKPPPVKEEPEKIRKWREEQKTRLEEKGKYLLLAKFHYMTFVILIFNYCYIIYLDAEEEKKKEEWKEAARKELEEWYKHHAEAISKTKTTNR